MEWCVLPLHIFFFTLRYGKLSLVSLCVIDYQLRPDSPASSGWLLRGTRARRRHDFIASWRVRRRQDQADCFSDSGRACGESWISMSFMPTNDASHSSMDQSWENRVVQHLSYVYVILASQSQLKYRNFIRSLTFLVLHPQPTSLEWKINSDLTGPRRPVPYTSSATATY